MEKLNIAIAAELTPAKTLIPILERINELDSLDKLNFKINKIIALYHGEPAKALLEEYCDEFYSIGEGRRGTPKYKLPFLIFRDILKAFKALYGKNVDLLITVGNAGDVRKSIVAANLLGIPILHIEQDIYNPIEVISQANMVTVPSENYLSVLEGYGIRNLANIHGYPMVKYIYKSSNKSRIKIIEDKFDILLVLGGDIKKYELSKLINEVESLNMKVLIAPYRFDKEFIESLTNSAIVLDQYIDMISYLSSCKYLIYAAGMGMTIEAGLLEVPSIKIEGFHKEHASVDLAKSLGIPVVKIEDISKVDLESIKVNSNELLLNSELAINEIVDIIGNFDFSSKRSGLKVAKNIWNVRKIYR